MRDIKTPLRREGNSPSVRSAQPRKNTPPLGGGIVRLCVPHSRDIKFSALADAAVKIYGADNRIVNSHLWRVATMGPFHYVRLERR